MFIVLHCGGMPFNGETIKERSLGGSESMAYYLAKSLVARGHEVTCFTNHPQESFSDGVKYVWAGERTPQCPMGDRFDVFACNTPCDVLIMQRDLRAFANKYLADVSLWWLHDLALYRSRDAALSQMYNVDGVLCVSEFHKNQIHDVYGISKDFLHVVNNCVDLGLYDIKSYEPDLRKDHSQFRMIYSSRPERGLENLVGPDGIMEKLWQKDQTIHLDVCGYDNTTPAMAEFYRYLWSRCEELPNVNNLGALDKADLAGYQMCADMYCYPTEFEEVSCITAMEAMAAEIPFLSSKHAALPETCKGSGSKLLPLDKQGHVNHDLFVKEIIRLRNDYDAIEALKEKQRESAIRFDTDQSALALEDIVRGIYDKKMSNKGSVARYMMQNSDIMRLKKYIQEEVTDKDLEKDTILAHTIAELEECYGFTESEEAYYAHYQNYYEYEKEVKKSNFVPHDLSRDTRFRSVLGMLSDVNDNKSLLDYGCAHGHYAYNLALQVPELEVHGVDISHVNIREANKVVQGAYAKQGVKPLPNLSFSQGQVHTGSGLLETEEGNGQKSSLTDKYDYIVLGEILEHVREPEKILNGLMANLKEGGVFIVTTPYGPWEHTGYEKEHPWRAHLWHFDKCEIHKMYSHLPNYDIVSAPYSNTIGNRFNVVGSFIYRFGAPEEPFKPVLDYIPGKYMAPRETISLCMIVKDAESVIRDCLQRVVDHVDEIIVGVDDTTTDNTRAVIAKLKSERSLWPIFKVFQIESPLKTGFDEARNTTIAQASGDWIMWVDSDEKVENMEYTSLHARYSPVQGFMVQQHHFSIQPLGLLKTDLPVRLFRNNVGIRFFGRVHEHPEKELNKGIGLAVPASNLCLTHSSYSNEKVRRARFSRNLELMTRDREDYPERTLGKFLWIRDLSQMCSFELEQTQTVTEEMVKRADRGIYLWEELVKENIRMAVDCLPFYSTLCKIKGNGFVFATKLNTSLEDLESVENGVELNATFLNKDHVNLLTSTIINEKVKNYGQKYY